jgi:hypothetical protein
MSSERPAVPKPGRTRPVTAAQVHAYAAKSEEFAAAAVSDLAAGRNIAATSLAIHAGINSADAICGARLGVRGSRSSAPGRTRRRRDRTRPSPAPTSQDEGRVRARRHRTIRRSQGGRARPTLRRRSPKSRVHDQVVRRYGCRSRPRRPLPAGRSSEWDRRPPARVHSGPILTPWRSTTRERRFGAGSPHSFWVG